LKCCPSVARKPHEKCASRLPIAAIRAEPKHGVYIDLAPATAEFCSSPANHSSRLWIPLHGRRQRVKSEEADERRGDRSIEDFPRIYSVQLGWEGEGREEKIIDEKKEGRI